MDEMKLALRTKFMRNVVAKIIAKIVYKKTGHKVNIQLNELDINAIDGEIYISTSVEAKLSSDEFIKILKSVDL